VPGPRASAQCPAGAARGPASLGLCRISPGPRTEQRQHRVRLGHVHNVHIRRAGQRLGRHANPLANLARARARLRIARRVQRRRRLRGGRDLRARARSACSTCRLCGVAAVQRRRSRCPRCPPAVVCGLPAHGGNGAACPHRHPLPLRRQARPRSTGSAARSPGAGERLTRACPRCRGLHGGAPAGPARLETGHLCLHPLLQDWVFTAADADAHHA